MEGVTWEWITGGESAEGTREASSAQADAEKIVTPDQESQHSPTCRHGGHFLVLADTLREGGNSRDDLLSHRIEPSP